MLVVRIFEQIRHKRRVLITLLGMIALYFFSYFQRMAVPGTVFNELQVDFKASAGAITALGALFLYVYGFWQIFAGMLADRYGGLRMLLIGGLLMTAGALVFPLAQSLSLLYTTRFLVAFGASFMYISLIKEIDTLFDRRHFAMLLSMTLFFGYSGGLVATLPLERSVAWFGWRNSFLGIGMLTAGVLLANFWLMKKDIRPAPRLNSTQRLLIKDIVQNKRSWYVIVPGSINFGIYFLFQASIGKKMLSDACGANSARAATIMFGMMLATMIFTSLSGFISRIIGNRRKPLILAGTSLIVVTLTYMLWVLTHSSNALAPMAIGSILIGIGISVSPLFTSTMKEINPEESAATSVGLFNCLSYLCVAIATNIAGLVMDTFHHQAVVTAQAIVYPVSAYRAILFGCLIAATAAWITALFIPETRGLNTYRQRPRF